MVTYPESFCDTSYNAVLTPVVYQQGRITKALITSFDHACGSGILPGGTLVRYRSAKDMYTFCIDQLINIPASGHLAAAWNTDQKLTSNQLSYVFEGLPGPRKNSKVTSEAEIEAGYLLVAVFCAKRGFTIDRTALPGTSKTWFELMDRHALLSRRMSPVTFKDRMYEMGFRFPKGRNHVRDWNFSQLILEFRRNTTSC
jgi:hypothetical protein